MVKRGSKQNKDETEEKANTRATKQQKIIQNDALQSASRAVVRQFAFNVVLEKEFQRLTKALDVELELINKKIRNCLLYEFSLTDMGHNNVRRRCGMASTAKVRNRFLGLLRIFTTSIKTSRVSYSRWLFWCS